MFPSTHTRTQTKSIVKDKDSHLKCYECYVLFKDERLEFIVFSLLDSIFQSYNFHTFIKRLKE